MYDSSSSHLFVGLESVLQTRIQNGQRLPRFQISREKLLERHFLKPKKQNNESDSPGEP